MSIGIIGAGALGSNAARLLVKSGVSATIANSRGPQSLSRLVGELGPSVKAGSVEEAASADMVLRRPRSANFSNALAISRSTLVSSTSADHSRHLRSARLRPLTSSSSDR